MSTCIFIGMYIRSRRHFSCNKAFSVSLFQSYVPFEQRLRLAQWNWFKPSGKIFLLTFPRRYFFCGSFVLFVSCVSHAFTSVHCCLVVTCCQRGDPLALVGDVYCIFCYFPMWYPWSGVVLDCIVSWSLPSFFGHFYASFVYTLLVFNTL